MTKILVVDDEAKNRELLTDYLELKGFEVITASGGKEALEKIKENPVIVLLDVKMDDMNGLQVLDRIKKRAPEIAVIMVTSMDEKVIANSSIERGATEYITKPIDLSHLEDVINITLLQMPTEE